MQKSCQSPNKDDWLAAVKLEMDTLDRMGCFGEQQQLPPGFKATNTSFLFVIKSNGQKKARLVFRNNPYSAYSTEDTYSPVVDRTALRIFLHESLCRGWIIEQGDVQNAYINAEMDQEVYIKMPKGFSEEKGLVRRLLKALYGHPKSGRLWYQKIAQFLATFGLQQSQREPCLFISQDCMIIFYVDDFLVSRPTGMLVDGFFGNMQQQYTVRRMGFPSEFLGMQIEYFPEINSAVLHQEKYILGLTRKFGIPEGRY
jgi:hypothetical protein